MLIFQISKRILYSFAYWFGCSIIRPLQIYSPLGRAKIAPTASVKFPKNIEVGSNVFINHNCCIWSSKEGKIRMGNDVLLGPGVVILSANHGIFSGTPVCKQDETYGEVVIGSDVWIGANTVILPGVTIGDGCVIGAGSIVSRSLPPNSICMGAPAKPMRLRMEYDGK